MNKKQTFVVYAPIYAQLMRKFNDSQKAALFDALLDYSSFGDEPDFSDDELLEKAWTTIKGLIDDDNQKYAEKCEKMSRNIKARYNKRSTKEEDTTREDTTNEIQLNNNCNTNVVQMKGDKDNDYDYDIKEKNKIKKENQNRNSIENSKFAKDLFGQEIDKPTKSHTTREEFNFYLSAFNHLFDARYQATPERLAKFKTRRKNFSLEQLVASLLAMSDNEFYQGKGEQGWKASPTFHLRNDENVSKFLESGDSKQFLADAKEAIDNKWSYYTQNLYPQSKQEKGTNAIS